MTFPDLEQDIRAMAIWAIILDEFLTRTDESTASEAAGDRISMPAKLHSGMRALIGQVRETAERLDQNFDRCFEAKTDT